MKVHTLINYAYISLLFFVIFTLEGCVVGPIDLPEINTNTQIGPQAIYPCNNVDSDGDGIYAYYDYDDTDPLLPGPFMIVQNGYGGNSHIYYSLYSQACSDTIFLRSHDFTIELKNTNGYTNLALFRMQFLFSNNTFYFRNSGGISWNYTLDDNHISSYKELFSEIVQNSNVTINIGSFEVQNMFGGYTNDAIAGNIFLLYNKEVLNTVTAGRIEMAIDTIGAFLKSGITGASISAALNEIKNNYYAWGLSSISDLLTTIRDYFPYGVYIEVYRIKQGIENNWIQENIINLDSTEGRLKYAFYPSDSLTISSWNYEIIKAGIKYSLPNFDDILWLWENLSSSVEYEKISGVNAGTIAGNWASDGVFKRFTFLHYFSSDNNAHALVLLPIFKNGLNMYTSTPHNGIVAFGSNITLANMTLIGSELSIKAKVLYDDSTRRYYTNWAHPYVITADKTGKLDVYITSISTIDEHKPVKGMLRFFSIQPLVSVMNTSSPTNIIVGDRIVITSSGNGVQKLDTNYNNILDFNVTNVIIVGNNKYYSLSNTYTLSNILVESNMVDLKTGYIQKNNSNFVCTNVILQAVKPVFVLSGIKSSYTNGETAILSFELDPSFDYLYNKFTNMEVYWSVTTNGINAGVGLTHYGTGESFIYTFTENGSYEISACLNYNSVQYQKTMTVFAGTANVAFLNITNGDYIYPSLGGRKIEFTCFPNTTVEFSNSASAGGFALTPNGTPQNPLSIKVGAEGRSNIYYIANNIFGNTAVNITTRIAGSLTGSITGLVIKYNNNFTLEEIMNDTNAVLTYESGSYH